MSTGFPPRPDDRAPDFVLPADDDSQFRLSDRRGQPVVLYFYPQDDTEGCAMENAEFSALADDFAALGVAVVGISPDTLQSHKSFRRKRGLRLPLLADPERRVIEAYGLWGPKVTFGHHHIGLHRTTVLIDAEGAIREIWPVKRIKGHAAQVLDAARALANQT